MNLVIGLEEERSCQDNLESYLTKKGIPDISHVTFLTTGYG